MTPQQKLLLKKIEEIALSLQMKNEQMLLDIQQLKGIIQKKSKSTI